MASKNRKNKVKFKLTKELVFLVLGLVAILVTSIVLSLESAEEKEIKSINMAIINYNLANDKAYNTITGEDVLEVIEYDDLKSTISQDGYVYIYYGSLTNASYLENLCNINLEALKVKQDAVYLYYSNWVDGQEDLDAPEFKEEAKKREDEIFNMNNDQYDVEDFDITVTPTLLVYKDGDLIFNSQSATEGWNQIIPIAFGLSVEING